MQIEKRVKVPNGKLLIIKADVDGGRIAKAAVQGDFFFYPEEKLPLFEEAIAGIDAGSLKDGLDAIVEREGIRLVGLTTEAVAELVRRISEEIKR